MNDRLFGDRTSGSGDPDRTGASPEPGSRGPDGADDRLDDAGSSGADLGGRPDGGTTGDHETDGVERMTVEIRPARSHPSATEGSDGMPVWLRDQPERTAELPPTSSGVVGTNGSPAAVAGGGTQPIRRWDVHRGARLDDVDRRPGHLPDRAEIPVPDEEAEPRDQGPGWYEIPVMLLLAFTLAFLLRTFVVQVFWIPSASMVDTLEVNDRIAVEKLSYQFGDIERGEVVVFAGDEAFGAGRDMDTADRVLTGIGQFLGVVPVDAQDFVKRVIGLPGDHVEIVDGQVIVNGVELDEDYATLDESNGEWDVPADKLFVMGDNRANSGDSRTSLGFIDTEDVVGRAVARIWPPGRVGSVEGVDWEPIPDGN